MLKPYPHPNTFSNHFCVGQNRQQIFHKLNDPFKENCSLESKLEQRFFCDSGLQCNVDYGRHFRRYIIWAVKNAAFLWKVGVVFYAGVVFMLVWFFWLNCGLWGVARCGRGCQRVTIPGTETQTSYLLHQGKLKQDILTISHLFLWHSPFLEYLSHLLQLKQTETSREVWVSQVPLPTPTHPTFKSVGEPDEVWVGSDMIIGARHVLGERSVGKLDKLTRAEVNCQRPLLLSYIVFSWIDDVLWTWAEWKWRNLRCWNLMIKRAPVEAKE